MTSFDLISQVKRRMASLTDPQLAPTDLSLTSCDREPIHISNAIQPHGLLLTFLETDLVILQISQNSLVFLGKQPAALLGQPLSILMPPEQIAAIRDCLNAESENASPLRLWLTVGGETQEFEGIVHRIDGVVVLELERALAPPTVNFFDFYKFVKAPIARLQNTATLLELSQQAVILIRQITGFDRVMLYRFDEDGSGHVIAENKLADAESFLGLHYPATDIPKQAKELYRLNLSRLIPDALSEPMALEPPLNPVTGAPLDLSLSVLRSVSPLHTEYLANMGVRASMSISLLRTSPLETRQLWGLIACHHYFPKKLSAETLTICEFLGQIVSSQIGLKVDVGELDYIMRLQTVRARFVNTISTCLTLSDGLQRNPGDLINLVGATGVVSWESGKIATSGDTPPAPAIADLLKWVDQQIGEDIIYSTNTLVTDYPEFLPYKDLASGLLALRISAAQQTYLLWFRPEVIRTIDWAGEPQKLPDTNQNLRIAPRKSFELWKETVQLQSQPWKAAEISTALELSSSIIGILLQKADELALLNTELERSNIELDAFAYVASHDLKEPLRGINNYSTFLIEDYGEQLGAEGKYKLATLMRLTQRMEDLINSLLYYSQLNRTELLFQSVDLGEVVNCVLDVIKISQPALALLDFQIPRPLPMVQCDRTQFNELLINLISNAIKYNDRSQKWIEIGYILPVEINQPLPAALQIHPTQTVFFVKDNGIGIRTKHTETIFKIFKRLHAAHKYGGGTGAGLTIAKKIVERHGGHIAVDSVFGEGSTFYFTLGRQL